MEELVTELLRPLGIFAILAVASVWLLRVGLTEIIGREREKSISVLEHRGNLMLEQFRMASERELEQFKAQLALAAEEHRIRFSALHQKRNETLADLYDAVADALSRASYVESAKTYLSSPQIAEDCQYIEDRCQAGRQLLARSRLYLEEQLVEGIRDAIDCIQDPAHLFLCDFTLKKHEQEPLLEPRQFPIEQARTRLRLMATEFRTLLGSAA